MQEILTKVVIVLYFKKCLAVPSPYKKLLALSPEERLFPNVGSDAINATAVDFTLKHFCFQNLVEC